eukprot:1852884-Pleurochrysis_carterae.AAC.1
MRVRVGAAFTRLRARHDEGGKKTVRLQRRWGRSEGRDELNCIRRARQCREPTRSSDPIAVAVAVAVAAVSR